MSKEQEEQEVCDSYKALCLIVSNGLMPGDECSYCRKCNTVECNADDCKFDIKEEVVKDLLS